MERSCDLHCCSVNFSFIAFGFFVQQVGPDMVYKMTTVTNLEN